MRNKRKMGINGLNKFIRKHCSGAFDTKSIYDYRGKTFAVDANIYIYKFKFANESKWLGLFTNFVNTFKQNDIKIFLVYDNKFPIEKNAKYQRQKKEKDNANQYVNQLEVDLIEFEKNGTQSHTFENMIKRYPPGILSYQDMIACEKERLNKRNLIVTRKEFQETKAIAAELNVEILVPEYEAETLCSAMCIRKEVDAVLSNDSDVFAYGVPICLSEMKLVGNEYFVTEYRFDDILKILELTYEQFRDFCIMCGCDYNSRIKNIGPERAYILIRKYKTLEDIEKFSGMSLDKLNYKRCREIFTIFNN